MDGRTRDKRQRAHQRRTGRSTIVAVAASALMAGCAGEDSSPAAEESMPQAGQERPAQTRGGENDPCTLVTASEAERVLAAPVEAERPSEANNEYLATCRYVAERGEGVVVLAVKVSRKNGPIGFQNAKRMEEEGFAIEPVSGVGDDAFWVGEPLHTLFVLQDTVYLDIGGDVQLDQVRPLAANAVQRLR